jgi:hypothetical protein
MKIGLGKITEDDAGETEDYELLEKFSNWLERNRVWNDNDGVIEYEGRGIGFVEYTFRERNLTKIIAWLNAHGICEAPKKKKRGC